LIYYEYVRIFQGRFVLFSFVPVEVWGLSFVVLNFEEFYGIFADCFVQGIRGNRGCWVSFLWENAF